MIAWRYEEGTEVEYFFFSSRRRHTRLQGDWSSDVCSSDLFNQPQAKPSFIYKSLVSYDLPSLLLVSVRHPRQIGTHVWQYITQLIHVRPPINGNHLKRLGYSPGPLYGQILTALTYAVLDGDIASVTSAEDHLNQYYPLKKGPIIK